MSAGVDPGLDHDTPMRLVTVAASRLTEESWAPFGWLPVPDTDRRDALHDLYFEWGDPHLNYIVHRYDEIDHTERDRCAR